MIDKLFEDFRPYLSAIDTHDMIDRYLADASSRLIKTTIVMALEAQLNCLWMGPS